jgi:hypothetical protein
LVANNNKYKVKGWNGQYLGVVKLLLTIVEMNVPKKCYFLFKGKSLAK